jgi:type IV pilus assembly protein PilQ
MTQSVVQLQYRPVDSIIAIIPKDIISDVQIIEYREQNSLLLSGSDNEVLKAEAFIRSIDKRAPVLSIEIIIVDYSSTHGKITGIEAGLSENAITTIGSVFPAPDITLSSESINSLINRFNGFGWARIGNVTPNFYASLKALETQGIVRIRSTPVLSTINGHRAELSIGKMEYYVEEQSHIYANMGMQTHTTRTYHPVTADLSITITPLVSGDEQITLDIEVNQSDFTERISPNAPPGEVIRRFKSHIRVQNGEMILLGGLEENRKDKISSGTPLISRIPIIKWLFSSRHETDSKTKLNIFIRPTIIG